MPKKESLKSKFLSSYQQLQLILTGKAGLSILKKQPEPVANSRPKNSPLTALDIQKIINAPASLALKTVLMADQAREQLQYTSKALWKKWFAMQAYLKRLARKYRAMAKKRHRRHHDAPELDNELWHDDYYANSLLEFKREFKAIWDAILGLNKTMKHYFGQLRALDKKQAALEHKYSQYTSLLNDQLVEKLQKDLQKSEHHFNQEDAVFLATDPQLHPYWENTADFALCLDAVSCEASPILAQELNLLALMLSHPRYKDYFEQTQQEQSKPALLPLLQQLRLHPLHARCAHRWERHAQGVERLNQTYQSQVSAIAERQETIRRAYNGCRQEMLLLQERLTKLEQQISPNKFPKLDTSRKAEDLNAQLGLGVEFPVYR